MAKARLHSGVFTSRTDEWPTPQYFFDALNSEFDFTLDPCSTHENHKCPKYFTKEDSGLYKSWKGERVFMNPPYGNEIGLWLKKAYQESREGALVVCLIPARTDTKYWHRYVMKASEIRLVKGRIKFDGAQHGCPFPSAVVVFRPLLLTALEIKERNDQHSLFISYSPP